MSKPQLGPTFPIALSENKDFLTGKANVTLNLTGDDVFVGKLLTNDPFPTTDVEVGKIAVTGSSNLPAINFGEGRGTVSFKASASGFGSVGVYHTAEALLDALHFVGDDNQEKESLSQGLVLSKTDSELFTILQVGYDVSAAAKGSVALGAAGTVDFGVDANRTALYAVIRRFANNTVSAQGLTETVQSWKLPSQLKSALDLAPGTWIVSEVNGSINAKVSSNLGYKFTFIRNARLGGLTGEMGLKVQLGLEAAFGLTASGRYAVVVSRPAEEPTIRLTLYKLKLHGLSFGLNAGAVLTTTSPLPATSDDFIKAVFGVHSAQIAKDLMLIDKVASLSPQQLPGVLAGVSTDYLKKLLEQLSGNNLETEFATAKSKVVGALKVWDNLATSNNGAAMKLWSMLEAKIPELDTLQSALKQITDLKTPADFKTLFEGLLPIKGFDQSPLGQFLFSALEQGPLAAVTDNGAFKLLHETAENASKLLDGSEVQDVIQKLQQFVNDKLSLDKIENAIKNADLSQLDELLKTKLAEFLKKGLDLPLLAKIQSAIKSLQSKRESIYAEVKKALNHDYSFNFAESYQSTTTNTALADLDFDFSGEDGQVDSVSTLFRSAVDGSIGDLLISSHPGVTVRSGVMSHRVQRDNHIEVTMPFFNFSEDHISDVTAKLEADRTTGRGIYLLAATDSVAKTVQHTKTLSSLTVALKVSGVNRYSALSASYGYSLRQFNPGITDSKLVDSLQPYVEAYFPDQFKSRSFSKWVDDLDANIEKLDPQFNREIFGDALLSLDVSLAEGAITAWFAAPNNKSAAVYGLLSRTLQKAFKQMLPLHFFRDLHQYSNLESASALLVYAAIPVMNDMTLDNAGKPQQRDEGDLIWGFQGTDAQPLRNAIITQTAQNLQDRLNVISPMLKAAGLDKEGFYDPGLTAVNRIRASVLDSSSVGGRDLDSLLFSEREIIFGARGAAISIAKFLGDPKAGLRELSRFGEQLTSTFHDNMDFIFGGDSLRPLATLVFLEAARTFASSNGSLPSPKALLGIAALKRGSAFTGDQFLRGEVPGSDDLLASEHIVSA